MKRHGYFNTYKTPLTEKFICEKKSELFSSFLHLLSKNVRMINFNSLGYIKRHVNSLFCFQYIYLYLYIYLSTMNLIYFFQNNQNSTFEFQQLGWFEIRKCNISACGINIRDRNSLRNQNPLEIIRDNEQRKRKIEDFLSELKFLKLVARWNLPRLELGLCKYLNIAFLTIRYKIQGSAQQD